MDLIQFEGRTVAVIAPEHLEAMESKIEELKIKIGMQQGLFNAAMDRCEKAESKLLAYQGEPNMAEMDALCDRYRTALEQIAALPNVSGYSDVYRIATDALKN